MNLLVTNYWYPYNNTGAFRWVHIGQHLYFDVLTCKKPRGGMRDETMPGISHKTYRYFSNLPAVLFGFFIIPFVLYYRSRYNKIIFTSPPESLLIPAWICQKLGSDVYIDMRDEIGRLNNTNSWKFLSEIWWWFYRRLKNRVAVNEVITERGTIIRHGYMELNRKPSGSWIFIPFKRYSYSEFKFNLKAGLVPDYRERPKDRTPSTFYTLRKYFKYLPKHFDDARMYSWPLFSYKEIAKQWEELLK